MAGTDNTLLALAGAGFPRRRSFGFASCDRAVGAAEGMNVLAQVRLRWLCAECWCVPVRLSVAVHGASVVAG